MPPKLPKPARPRRCKCGNPVTTGIGANGRPRTTCQRCYDKKNGSRARGSRAVSEVHTAVDYDENDENGQDDDEGEGENDNDGNGEGIGGANEHDGDEGDENKKNGSATAAPTAAPKALTPRKQTIYCNCGNPAEGVTPKGQPLKTCLRCRERKMPKWMREKFAGKATKVSTTVPATVTKAAAATAPKTVPTTAPADLSKVQVVVAVSQPRLPCNCGRPTEGFTKKGAPRTTCLRCYERKNRSRDKRKMEKEHEAGGVVMNDAPTEATPNLTQETPTHDHQIEDTHTLDPLTQDTLAENAAADVVPTHDGKIQDAPSHTAPIQDALLTLNKDAPVSNTSPNGLNCSCGNPACGTLPKGGPRKTCQTCYERKRKPTKADKRRKKKARAASAPEHTPKIGGGGMKYEPQAQDMVMTPEVTLPPLGNQTFTSENAVPAFDVSDNGVTHTEEASSPMEGIETSGTVAQSTDTATEPSGSSFPSHANVFGNSTLQGNISGTDAFRHDAVPKQKLVLKWNGANTSPGQFALAETTSESGTPACSSSKVTKENVGFRMGAASGTLSTAQLMMEYAHDMTYSPANDTMHNGDDDVTMEDESDEFDEDDELAPLPLPDRPVDPQEIANLEKEIEDLQAALAAQRSACRTTELDTASIRRAHNEIYRLRSEICVKTEELWRLSPSHRFNPYGLYTKAQLAQDDEGVCPPSGSKGFGKKPVWVLPTMKLVPPLAYLPDLARVGKTVPKRQSTMSPSRKHDRDSDDEGDDEPVRKAMFRSMSPAQGFSQ